MCCFGGGNGSFVCLFVLCHSMTLLYWAYAPLHFMLQRGADGIKYSLACSTGAAMEQCILVPLRHY